MSLLQLKGVEMRFGGLLALAEFSLEVPAGEIHGLIGPNGAGKTTVFNLISGFYRPTQGEIRFQGRSLLGLSPAAIVRLGIARTFQNIRLFNNLSVLDNVLVAFHPRRRTGLTAAIWRSRAFRQEEEAFIAKAWELLTRFELAPWVREPAGRLAYGQQRRLELVRALATGPKLLLLDEPAAGLNPQETAALLQLLKEIQKEFGLTILIIEHDMKFIMNICERLTVLDHGLIIAQGPPSEVRQAPQVIRAYLGATAGA